MKQRFLSLFLLLGILVSTLAYSTINQTFAVSTNLMETDGPPYTGWSFSVNSSLNGLHTWSAAEFMALPNITGWSQQIGYTEKHKYKGVNFTWLMENYGDLGEGLSYKIVEITGFLATKDYEAVINNATHCHIIAYEFDDVIMDQDFNPRIVPVALDPDDNILFVGNQHPRHVEIIHVIGQSEARASEAAMIFFVIVFSSAVLAVGVGIFATFIYLDRRKKPAT